jgi:mannose-1-phosphate guanylyltransferase
MKNIVPVILAGGIGERFWPLSRSSRPKQLLPLISRRTMVEETFARTRAIASKGIPPLVITSGRIAGQMKKVLSKKWKYDLIVEPVGKNTAPALALAAAWIEARHGESIMAALPADHLIEPQNAYLKALRYACELADRENNLIVFAVSPTRPETGYGYLQLDKGRGAKNGVRWHGVSRFIEKPDAASAASYCRKKNYRWNSGMFVWKTSVLLEEVRQYLPGLHAQVLEAARGKFSAGALLQFYNGAEKESIDYGIMERSKRVSAVAGEFSWDDIGSWEAMSRIYGVDATGTTVAGDHLFQQACTGSILINRSSLAVAAIGCKDIALIATDDAILAVSRAMLPELKKYLAAMKSSGTLPTRLF